MKHHHDKEIAMTITYEDFTKVDIRSGTIIKAEEFPETRKPAYKIWVDFGAELGIKQTSAQVTVHYTPNTLIGLKVIGVVNFPIKKIAGFNSEFLLLGLSDEAGAIRLVTFDNQINNGQKLH